MVKPEEVNVNPGPSPKSCSSVLSPRPGWAFVALMNECSDKKGGRVVVELSGPIMGWGHVLQRHLYS